MKKRFEIAIAGRKIRLINTVKLVFEPRPGTAASYSEGQARRWVKYLADQGIAAELIDTGERY